MARRTFVIGATATAFLASVLTMDAALADKNKRGAREGDHDDALTALQKGEVRSLPEILLLVRPKIKGEIIETEFEYEDCVPVYEFKYIDKNGRVREMYVDARKGTILKDKQD
jgi:uncharacterized membrane protein YkoI